ncbi:hypothetical protein WJX81_003231 [Elliptochloris bilobata]|uniref:Sulfotransferase n=1 Tax=Elliptochloris bilobata TaxID=381761 RepID=A0AAW1S3C1_9CHLO
MQYAIGAASSAIVVEAEPYEGQGHWKVISSFCILSERSSGSNYLESLIKANLQLPVAHNCPWKHEMEYDLAKFNPFADLDEDVLVVAIVRNAIDWVSSLYMQPYYAPSHCDASFADFLTRPWTPGKVSESKAIGAIANSTYCAKTQSSHQEYEQKQGHYASSVLELRTWKLKRIRKLCNTRRQASCVRYEDLLADPQRFLERLTERFHIKVKLGFFQEVTSYKGIEAPEHRSYKPSSEAQRLRGGYPSSLYNATTLALLRHGLDLRFEASLDYFYDDIFRLYGLQRA